MNLSIIVPAFNEASTIAKVLEAVLLLDCNLQQVLVVDDGSTDETVRIANKIADSDPRVRVICHPKNMGKTAAIRTGLKEAVGDIVIIQDADLEYDPAEIPDVIAPILCGQADVVYGSRFLVRKAARVLYFSHYLANKSLTFLSNVLTNRNMTDVETCYKAFRREVIQLLGLSSSGFGMEIEITAMVCKTRARTYEVPISYYGRTYEEGKKIGLRDGIAALWYIFYYNLIAPRLPAGRAYITRTNAFLSQQADTQTLLASDEPPVSSVAPASSSVEGLLSSQDPNSGFQSLKISSLFLTALMLGCIAFLLMRIATQAGVLVNPDSATYLAVAESLRTESSFSDAFGDRLSHYPPGYPVSLYAISSLTGLDIRNGSPRFFHCACYALFIAVSFVFFAHATGSRFFGSVVSTLLLLSVHLVTLFASALSDGPFLCAVALATYAVCCYLQSRSRLSLRVAAALTAYAFLLRFVGIIWVTGFALSVWYLGGVTRQSIRDAMIFAGISMAPMFLWVASGLVFGGNPTNREITWHPVDGSDVLQLFTSLTTFSFVQTGNLWVCLGALVGLVAQIGFVREIAGCRSGRTELRCAGAFVILAAVISLGCGGFLVISKSLIDRATPFDARLLAPVSWMLIPAAALSVGAMDRLKPSRQSALRDSVIGLLLVIVFASSLNTFVYRLPRCQSGELGLNDDIELDRILHRWLLDNAGERLVYSNKPWLPYLASKLRSVRPLPVKVDYTSGLVNHSYVQQVGEIQDKIKQGTAMIVYWTDGIADDAYSPMSLDEVKAVGQPGFWVDYDRFSTVGIPILAVESHEHPQ